MYNPLDVPPKNRHRLSQIGNGLVILLTIVWSDTAHISANNTNVKVIVSGGTFQEAVDTCATWKEGWSLMRPRSGEEEAAVHKRLIEEMQNANLQKMWIPLRQIPLNGWRNVDNTTYDGEIQLAEKQDNKCSLLKLRYEAVKSETCNSQAEGYICQIDDCDHCLYDVSPRNCLQMDNRCHIIGCDVGGWYDARNTCSRQGLSIISIQTNSQLRKIVTWLNSRGQKTCDNYWVGLRKEAWYYKVSKGFHEADSTYWYKGEPKPEGRCAVIQRFDEGYYWKTVACEEKHPFVCAQEQFTSSGQASEDHNATTGYDQIEHEQHEVLSQAKSSLKDDYPCQRLVDVPLIVVAMILLILCFMMVFSMWCHVPIQPYAYLEGRIRKSSSRDISEKENENKPTATGSVSPEAPRSHSNSIIDEEVSH